MADPQQDMAGIRNKCARDASSHVLPSERDQYPVHIRVDFSKLRSAALRKYMVFYGMPEVPHGSKEQLAGIVARHFDKECKKTNERSSIATFVTHLTGSNDTVEAAKLLQAQPLHHFNGREQNCTDDKENQSRRHSNDNFDMVKKLLATECEDNRSDMDHEDSSLGRTRRSVPIPTRFTPLKPKSRGRTHRERSESSEVDNVQMKKKRKGRLYCVCHGASFGNMIACDNKKCLDRSNWYHMDCVHLDPYEEAPDVWYCPACETNDSGDIPENQYRKPAASVTYGDMISHALTVLPGGKGSFKEICDFVETEYESQLNWKLESDQRKSPVWKSSVRKILFSNVRFRKYPEGKGMFCLAA